MTVGALWMTLTVAGRLFRAMTIALAVPLPIAGITTLALLPVPGFDRGGGRAKAWLHEPRGPQRSGRSTLACTTRTIAEGSPGAESK